MTIKILPSGFEKLERFVEKWALPDDIVRVQVRESSSQDELKDFYNVAKGEIDKIIIHLKNFTMDNMPTETVSLYRLALSFMEVGFLLERVMRTERSLVYPLSRVKFEPINVF
jgi:hypothetical protein